MLYRGSRVLILDEPTAVLTPQETAELFVNMKKMAAAGCAVVFITHKMNEVQDVADRVTVLRGGKVSGTMICRDVHAQELVWLMVGREIVLNAERCAHGQCGGEILVMSDVQRKMTPDGRACRKSCCRCALVKYSELPEWPAMVRKSWRKF